MVRTLSLTLTLILSLGLSLTLAQSKQSRSKAEVGRRKGRTNVPRHLCALRHLRVHLASDSAARKHRPRSLACPCVSGFDFNGIGIFDGIFNGMASGDGFFSVHIETIIQDKGVSSS